jgi:hypothetical protein
MIMVLRMPTGQKIQGVLKLVWRYSWTDLNHLHVLLLVSNPALRKDSKPVGYLGFYEIRNKISPKQYCFPNILDAEVYI